MDYELMRWEDDGGRVVEPPEHEDEWFLTYEQLRRLFE